jgi:serine/threonine-protein kinase
VLYEAVTGTVPFTASNYHALLRAIVEDAPPSILDQAAGDEALWAILQRGLAKDPRDRFQSMLELGQALAGWLLSHDVRVDAAGSSLQSKWLTRPDAASGGPPAPAEATPSRERSPDSSGATGVVRGPFTHTIAPHSGTRPGRRAVAALGAFSLAGVLLGAWLLVLLLRSPTHGAPVDAPRADLAAASLASVVTTIAPTSVATVEAATSSAPSADSKATAPEPLVRSVGPAPAPTAARQEKASVSAPREPPPARRAAAPAPSVSAVASKPSPALSAASPAAAPPPAKPGDRALDLLAPY